MDGFEMLTKSAQTPFISLIISVEIIILDKVAILLVDRIISEMDKFVINPICGHLKFFCCESRKIINFNTKEFLIKKSKYNSLFLLILSNIAANKVVIIQLYSPNIINNLYENCKETIK